MKRTANESIIIERILRGLREEYCYLLHSYERSVFELFYRALGNERKARELAVETFLVAYFRLPEFQPATGFAKWLHRIALRVGDNYIDSRQFQQQVKSKIEEAVDFEEGNVDVKDEQRMLAVFGLLKARFRHVLALRGLLQKSDDETSAILGISVETVNLLLCEARMLLAQEYFLREKTWTHQPYNLLFSGSCENTLGAEEERGLIEHLDVCGECRSAFAEFRAVMAWEKKIASEEREFQSIVQSVMSRIKKEQRFGRKLFVALLQPYLWLMVAVIAVILGGFFFLRRSLVTEEQTTVQRERAVQEQPKETVEPAKSTGEEPIPGYQVVEVESSVTAAQERFLDKDQRVDLLLSSPKGEIRPIRRVAHYSKIIAMSLPSQVASGPERRIQVSLLVEDKEAKEIEQLKKENRWILVTPGTFDEQASRGVLGEQNAALSNEKQSKIDISDPESGQKLIYVLKDGHLVLDQEKSKEASSQVSPSTVRDANQAPLPLKSGRKLNFDSIATKYADLENKVDSGTLPRNAITSVELINYFFVNEQLPASSLVSEFALNPFNPLGYLLLIRLPLGPMGAVKLSVEFNTDYVTAYRLVGEQEINAKNGFIPETLEISGASANQGLSLLYEIALKPNVNVSQPDLVLATVLIEPSSASGRGRTQELKVPFVLPIKSLSKTSADFRFAASAAYLSAKINGARVGRLYSYRRLLEVADKAVRDRAETPGRSAVLPLINEVSVLDK